MVMPTAADEKPVELKKAPGLIRWRGTVVLSQPGLRLDELAVPESADLGRHRHKMIKAFGAPIDEADAKSSLTT